MDKYLDILGYSVIDLVSQYRGVATAVSFDVSGEVQVKVRNINDASKPDEEQSGRWFNYRRLLTTTSSEGKSQVMKRGPLAAFPGG